MYIGKVRFDPSPLRAHFSILSFQILGLSSPKVIYVESFARVNTLSLSGKLLRPFVDRWVISCARCSSFSSCGAPLLISFFAIRNMKIHSTMANTCVKRGPRRMSWLAYLKVLASLFAASAQCCCDQTPQHDHFVSTREEWEYSCVALASWKAEADDIFYPTFLLFLACIEEHRQSKPLSGN